MAWTRASQLGRTLQCLGSVHLFNTVPEIRLQPKSERATDAAEYGTLVHHWKETGEIVGKPGHVKTFNKKLGVLAAAGISRTDIWPVSGYHEVSVAFNCVDQRVDIFHSEGDKNATDSFKLSHSEPWVTGTLDYYSLENEENGKRLVVDDLKTGLLFDKSPDELAQTYFYLMCLEKIYKTGNSGIVGITHWPKYPIEGLPNRTTAEIEVELLYQFEERLMSDYQKYKSGSPPFRLGNECDYCPVRTANLCPIIKERLEA